MKMKVDQNIAKNELSNEKKKANRRIIFEILISLFICITASYLLILTLRGYIIYNTDTYAPIEQINLLLNKEGVNLSELKLARIPSLIPDLALIALIMKTLGSDQIYIILSTYSFAICFLFLVGSSCIISFIIKSRYSFFLGALISSSINTLLIQISVFYRESLGIFLSPLHHGGNILMTIYFLIWMLFLRDLSFEGKKDLQIYYFTIPAFIGLSIISNMLFIFTCIIPYLFVLLYFRVREIYSSGKLGSVLYRNLSLIVSGSTLIILSLDGLGVKFGVTGTFSWVIGNVFTVLGFFLLTSGFAGFWFVKQINFRPINNNKFFSPANYLLLNLLYFKDYLNLKIDAKKLTLISLPTLLIIFSSVLLLNKQCDELRNINYLSTFNAFSDLITTSKTLLLLVLSLLILILYKTYAINSSHLSKQILPEADSKIQIISLFIGISGLSPIIYLWFAGGLIPLRYILSTSVLGSISIGILLCLLFMQLSQGYLLFKKFIPFLLSIYFIGTFISINDYISTGIDAGDTEKTLIPSKAFRLSAMSGRFGSSGFAISQQHINQLGLSQGLSDFWGSSISYIGNYPIKVSPVLQNGKPNLWAHSVYNFRDLDSNKISDYNFVFSNSEKFTKSIIKVYGMPEKIYISNSMKEVPIVQTEIYASLNDNLILTYPRNTLGWSRIQKLIKEKTSEENCT